MSSEAKLAGDEPPFVYFGNLYPHEPQFKSGLFEGLALKPQFPRDVPHDATQPLPYADGTVRVMQAQDVFEHIDYAKVPSIFDDIFRCLAPGGVFRMSVPDYNCPMLQARSVYTADGRILCDLAMGGKVSCAVDQPIKVQYWAGAQSHVWFPDYTNVMQAILASQIRKCTTIKFHHVWLNRVDCICEPFDQSVMPVLRSPPNDMRADGKPISMIVDFIR